MSKKRTCYHVTIRYSDGSTHSTAVIAESESEAKAIALIGEPSDAVAHIN